MASSTHVRLATDRSDGSAHILVVEDHSSSAMVTGTVLELLGYTYTHVINGEEALRIIKDNACAAIIMDLVLPGMSGIDAVKAIRARERLTKSDRVPIIGITVDYSSDGKSACLEAGMNAYMKKPFQIDELENILTCNLRAADG